MSSIKISIGNTKLGNIPNINLPPGISCDKTLPCLTNGCYALKAWKQYPNVRDAWNMNFVCFKLNAKQYFSDIVSWLNNKKKNVNFFRWHSAGDIIDQNYLDGMIYVANNNPTTNFLAYTKKFDLNFYSAPSNLQIIFSMWPNLQISNKLKINNARFSWVDDGTDNRIANIQNSEICPGSCRNCKKCWVRLYNNIIFKKH